MDRTLRVLVIILVVLLAMGGVFTYTVYAAVKSAGMITVNVHPKDSRPSFTVPFPAAFINAFADAATVHDVSCDGELEAWRPAINAAMAEFDRYPDMTFLEIDDYEDHVAVRKAGGKLIVDVDSDEAVVQVSIPGRTVRKFVNAMTSVHIDRDRDWDVEITVDDNEMDI